jgi:hypothetical protein
MDKSVNNSTPGSKRPIDLVSPSSDSGSPDLKTFVTESSISNSNMAAINKDDEVPGWFLDFNADLDRRLAKVIEDTMSAKLDLIDLKVQEASDAVRVVGDHLEDLEKRFATIENENAKLRSQIAYLQSSNVKLSNFTDSHHSKLNDLENYSRRENLIFQGVMEDYHETQQVTMHKIYRILEQEMQIPHARHMKFDACHRIGQISTGKPRQIIVRFNWRHDRDIVWGARYQLSRPLFLVENLSQYSEEIRQKLRPALHAAKNCNEKAHIKGDFLFIQGRKYSHNDLHKLPAHILPGTKSSDKRVAFFGKDAVFSNFHPATFTVDGVNYNCTEQFYHVQKAECFKDDERAAKMMKLNDPVAIMHLGKHVSNFDQKIWEQTRRGVMLRGNMAKYKQNPHLRKVLLSTGDKELMESSPHDTYWGTGIGLRSKFALNSLTFRGQNHMGQTLTIVREHMKALGPKDITAPTS